MAAESDLLLEEIQELAYQMRDLTKTVIDANENIAKAFGRTAESVKKATKLVDQFGKEIESNTDAVEDNTEQTKKQTKESGKLTEETKRAIHSRLRERTVTQDLMKEFGEGVNTTSLFRNRIEAAGDQMGQYGGSVRIATAAVEGLTQSAIQYGSALYKGERGALVTAKALTTLTKPLNDLADVVSGALIALSFIPGVGLGIRLLGAGLGAANLALKGYNKFNELAAEQADKLYTSFRSLSQSGFSTARGMDEVFDQLQTLGMTMAELEDFNKIIASNTQRLGMFGATIAEGGKRFADVAGTLYKSRLGEQLEMLGVSAAEQREIAMEYMAIQAKTGQLQLKNTTQLVNESGKFAKELDLMAQLTGQTRQEQARQREAALADERFRAATIAARARGDTAELARLERFGAAAAAVRSFDPRGATGILQAGAARGALTTPEAVAAEMTYGISRTLGDPNLPLTDALRQMAQYGKVTSESLAPTGAMIGTIKGIQTDIVGIDNFVTRMGPIIDAAARTGMSVSDFLETAQGKRMIAGGDTRLMVQAGRAQQSAAMILDSVVADFNGAAQLNMSAAEKFAGAVNQFAGRAGVRPPPGGTPGRPPAAGAPTSPRAPGLTGGPAKPTTGDYLQKMMQLESGGRNIPTGLGGGTSSAFGLYQITKTTFDGLVANAPPGSPLKGKTFEDMKADTELQTIAATMLTDENARKLAARGLSTSDAAKYMAHVLGYPTAARILEANQASNIGSIVSERARINNPKIFQGVATAGDLRKRFSDITGGGGYRYGGIATGPTSGYSAVLHGTEAIIPLANGNKIKIDMPDFADNMRGQMDVMSAQLSRLDDLVSVMRNQLAVSDKILQVSRA